MKVYYEEHDWKDAALINDYLDGRYPKEQGSELFVTDASEDTANLWATMEYHDISLQRVYEIDLPHSDAELAPYKCERQPLDTRGYWNLPWYIVAGHPVKIMEASIEHRVIGTPPARYAPPSQPGRAEA